MVTLTIDGRTVQAQEGATILEAAAQADIHIPHLCYLKGINEIAACRVFVITWCAERWTPQAWTVASNAVRSTGPKGRKQEQQRPQRKSNH